MYFYESKSSDPLALGQYNGECAKMQQFLCILAHFAHFFTKVFMQIQILLYIRHLSCLFFCFLRHISFLISMQKNRNTMQPQSRLPSLRFTMRTYCRTPVEKERFDPSVRQVLRKSRSATLSTAYCMVFLFSRSLCQRKIWMLAVYAVKSTWHQGKYGLDYKCKKGCEKTQSSFSHPHFFVSYFAYFTANNAYY